MASSAFCLCRATTLLIPYIFLAALAHPASLSSGTKPTRTFCFGRRTRTSSPTVTTGEVERFLGAVSDGAHSSLHRSYNASLHIDAQNRTMYAVAQCRPDVPASDCAACLAASSWFLAAGAASCADAAVWHEYGRCFFRYSDRDTSRFREDELAATVFNSSGRPARHGRAAVTGLLAAAMDRLDRRMQKRRLLGSTRAGDGVAWGWGAANSSAGQVYGAVQCAPGIARADCVRCLRGALAVAERDYNGSAGMQVLLLNCTARYESYRFYGKVSPDTDVITSAGPASPTADLAYATADPNYVLPSPAVIGIDITTPISPPPAAHGLPAGTNSTVPSTRPPAAPPEATSMSSVASAPEVSNTNTEDSLKRKSGDVGWDYGVLVNPNNLDKVKCILCDKVVSGGIYRIKQHIAHISGNVAKCPKSTKEDQVKCRNSIAEAKNKKKSKKAHEDEVREDVTIRGDGEDDEGLEEIGEPIPRKLGPMDKFANPIDPHGSSLSTQELKRQQKITEAIWKERHHKVKQYVARWLYVSGVPFNAINNDEFKQMLEAIGRFGPGFRGPSQYDVREPLLKEEVLRTNELLKAHEEERAMTGCSLMTDAWTDQKRRSIMNLCVHFNLGTSFIGSKETSDDAHASEYIFEYVDGCIDTIGHQNVVQIVTDNASNNMGTKELMKAKRPNIFWSSCATHTIDLMLQGIGNMPKYKKTLEQAKALTVFIYSHHKTLALMRKHTKRRDIIRPGVTRFASAFLTLQSLIEKKVELRAMALSKEWEESAHTKKGKGVTATATLISRSFWNGVNNALKVFEPLVKVLRMVDGDGPSMAFLYGQILEAKKKIKEALNNSESNYNLIINAIDGKMKGRLDSPLHLTAYLLNPYYSYGDRSIFLEQDIMDGFIECVEIFYHGNDEVMD